MDDLIEDALERAAETETTEVAADAFGPPQCCYLGCGTRGCARVETGLADREYTNDPLDPPETLVETACLDQTASDRAIDRALEATLTDADASLLTADCTEPGVDSLIRTIAAEIDVPVIALLSCDADCEGHPQFEDVTEIRFDTAAIDRELGDSAPIGPAQLTDRLIRQFATDFVALSTVPLVINADYRTLWDCWEHGGVATPFLLQLDRTALAVETIESALTPIGPGTNSPQPATWIGYVTAGQSVRLEEFETLSWGLAQTLSSTETVRPLGVQIDDELGDSIAVRGVWVA